MKRTNRLQGVPYENQKRRKTSPASDRNSRESPMSESLDGAGGGSSDTGQFSPPAGPTIRVYEAEDVEESLGSIGKTPESATKYQVSEKSQESPQQRKESSKPLDATRRPQSPAGSSFNPSTIAYSLRVTFQGSPDSKLVEELSVLLHKPESYQEIERVAEKHAKKLYAESIGPKDLKLSYGNCTIVSDDGTKTRIPLRSREDWMEVENAIARYWNPHTHGKLRLYISRHYLACQDQPTDDISFAELKGLEINDLMKPTWEKKEYVPRNVLETVISDQTIYWIIKESPPNSVPQDNQDAFIHQVQAEGRILLAMCVHADLGMDCLKKLLDNGWKDSNLPLNEDSRCHRECRRKFKTLVQAQGGFRAEYFVEGEYKTLRSHAVVPLYFCSRAHGNDDVDREVTGLPSNEVQNSSSGVSRIRTAAFCGHGAYSNVYCVKMDPNHHSLSTDLDSCFALKEFRDIGDKQRSSKDFGRELEILTELRQYSHPHIVTHLAAWTQEERYYMLFPYAQCDLREYMGENTFNKKDASWLLDQFHGMAEAVERIHYLSGPEAPTSGLTLTTSAAGERRTAWHHDLKPENILFFKTSSSSRGTFRISDWGSGKVNAYHTRSYHTKSAIGTLTYEPPEYTRDKKTSRPSDLWSLGCVFLELLIWAVFGSTSVDTFSDQRNDKRNANSETNSMKDDAFWQQVGNEYVLRKDVITQLERLEKSLIQPSAPPFREVVRYVRRMLEIKTHERIKARELCGLLSRTQTIEVESPKDEAEPITRQSLIPNDHHSPEMITHGHYQSGRSAGPIYAENVALSPSDMSSRASRGQHSRNSSASELTPSSATRSRQSSNASTLSMRERRGSRSSANSPGATEGGS